MCARCDTQIVKEQDLLSRLKDGEHLVCYDYGTGGLWGVVIAPSASAIREKYPELGIADALPKWMSPEDLDRKRETPLWLDDDPPQGLLNVLMSDRDCD